MLTTESTAKPSRGPSFPAFPSSSLGRRKNGYEPSDTESEWPDSPWDEAVDGGAPANVIAPPQPKSTPPMVVRPFVITPRSQRGHGENPASFVKPSRKTSPLPRMHGRSPHDPVEQESHGDGKSYSNRENQRHVSPYRTMARADSRDLRGRDDPNNGSIRRRAQRTPPKLRDVMVEDGGDGDHFQEVPRASEMSSSHMSRRSKSAPKPRDQPPLQPRQLQPHANSARRQGHSQSPLGKRLPVGQRQNPSATEITEMTESVALDGIFFSQHRMPVQKDPATKIDGGGACPTPSLASQGAGNAKLEQQWRNRARGFNPTVQTVSGSSVFSRSYTNRSFHSAVSRHSSSTGLSNDSSRTSDGNGSLRKFTANRQKKHMDSLFSCVIRGTCSRSKSPDARAVDEASYIERAFVVEELRQFWADKHRPRFLGGFICHKQQAQQLQKLISYNSCPHIILRGPPGSGKRSLTLALLHEIFGDSSEKVSNELRRFLVQEARSTVLVPLTSSPHHVELDIKSEPKNARYALMGVVKEIANNHAIMPEISDSSLRAEYKVIVLYAGNKVAENIQHLIKWVMDCYTDACKIVLCCEDENHVFESVRARCKLVIVDAPETPEIAEVLLKIAKKENFELSMGFAVKIATNSKNNLRKAIMALESCKSHIYPFVDDQPILIDWEEALIEIASEVLADPSPTRLFNIRGRLQKLLVEFVHPRLILQKLVEEFLKGVQACFRRELYYWHAYYDKRLPIGTAAQLKLEEFVAKFMSIQRKSSPGSLEP